MSDSNFVSESDSEMRTLSTIQNLNASHPSIAGFVVGSVAGCLVVAAGIVLL